MALVPILAVSAGGAVLVAIMAREGSEAAAAH
jgi:hypothetical protein